MYDQTNGKFTHIKVLGFGGSGCNTISRLHTLSLKNIELIAANTDFLSLSSCQADKKVHLGKNTSKGLGTGGDLRLGKIAAEESYKELIFAIQDADLVFLTTGMGGGTGSGAIEIAARIASSLDIPTISFVTLPFSFESENRVSTAYEGTMNLQPYTNTLITIPNDKILSLSDKETPMVEALGMADTVLINSILGLSDLINNSGAMNIDISYILRELKRSNGIFISRGIGNGNARVINAIQDALRNPLINAEPIQNAGGVIIKFNGNLSINEINNALEYLREETFAGIEITPIIEESSSDDAHVMVSIMLTGLGATPISQLFTPEHQEQTANRKKGIGKEEPAVESIISEQQYDDILEVPAFLRKGYNLEK